MNVSGMGRRNYPKDKWYDADMDLHETTWQGGCVEEQVDWRPWTISAEDSTPKLGDKLGDKLGKILGRI